MKRIIGSILVVLCISQITLSQQGRSNEIIAVENVNLVPMTSEKIVSHQTVIIKRDRIIEIGTAGKVEVPKEAFVIDGTGKYLMPGLADMHVHFGSREWETPDANLYLANGVTTVRDLTQGASVSSIKKWCNDFNTKKRLGPTIYNAWTIWGNESHIMETVPLIKLHGYDCLKVNDYLSKKDLFAVITKAKVLGIYVLGHIPYSAKVADVIAAGIDELSHVELVPVSIPITTNLDSLPKDKWGGELLTSAFRLMEPVYKQNSQPALENLEQMLNTEILKLKGKGISITTTLVADETLSLKYNDTLQILARPYNTYLPKRFWDDLRSGKDKNSYFRGKEKAAEVFYELVKYSMKEIRKSHIPIVAGTDAGPTFMGIVPGFSLHDELKLLVKSGYTPFEALAASTRDASNIVQKMTGKNEFGTIDIGKRADLILLEHNPLEDINDVRKPLGVMTAGVWLPKEKLDQLLVVKRKIVTPILREVFKKFNDVDSVMTEYRNLSSRNYFNEYYMSESVLTTIGYDILNLGRTDEAIKIFKLNIDEYPFAANPYDCLAEAYLKNGKKSLAIEYYRKALSIDPDFESSIKALQELER